MDFKVKCVKYKATNGPEWNAAATAWRGEFKMSELVFRNPVFGLFLHKKQTHKKTHKSLTENGPCHSKRG